MFNGTITLIRSLIKTQAYDGRKNISRENVKIALFVLFEPQHAANKEKNFAAKNCSICVGQLSENSSTSKTYRPEWKWMKVDEPN